MVGGPLAEAPNPSGAPGLRHGEDPNPSVVLGLRHGEVHNPRGVVYAGLPGFRLSEAGRRQAEAAAEALRGAGVVAIYCSPLERAVETAGILAAAVGVEVVADERLGEWRFWSRWAGKTWEELRERGGEDWEAYLADPASARGEESLAELADRTEAWLSDARARHPRGVVVAVSHLEPLRALLLRRAGLPLGALHRVRIGCGQLVRLAPAPSPQAVDPGRLGELLRS